jgi:hypothetical protein
MDLVSTLVDQLMSAVGDLWLLALIGSFFVMICESAKPKRQEGEARKEATGWALLVNILSLITPLLLFIHAFATGSGALIAIVAAIGAAVIGAAVTGWLISAFAPDFGRTLNRAAPFLAVPVFALAAYVSWQSVFNLVNFFVTAAAR